MNKYFNKTVRAYIINFKKNTAYYLEKYYFVCVFYFLTVLEKLIKSLSFQQK